MALEGPTLRAASAALAGLGLRPRLPVTEEQLVDEKQFRQWVAERNLLALSFADPAEPLREVDLVVAPPVPFDEFERSADRMRAGSTEIAVASIDALIRMKSGTGRAQDESDAEALRRVKEQARGD